MKPKKTYSTLFLSLFFAFTVSVATPLLYADDVRNFSHISTGFTRVLGAALQIPRYLIYKTLSGPPGLGTVDGALTGTFYAVKEITEGSFEMAAGAAPYAKYLAFFI